jgi:2,4-dienoyl-CoA reductase-like NADH-dependent reductase (Old Yellow Enzyme family)
MSLLAKVTQGKQALPPRLTVYGGEGIGKSTLGNGTPAPILAFRDENIETRYPAHKAFEAVSDDYLDKLPARFLKSAALLKSAGFDGVDIKMCHRYLLSELLAGFTRPGKYGGSYENRTRLIKNVFSEVGKLADENFLLCSRMGIYDAIEYPFGFGVDKKDKSLPDFGEPICLINELAEMGLSLVNVTMGTPYYNPYVNKPHRSGFADPLGAVNTLLDGAAVIKAECPGVKVVSTGYSYLKTDAFDRGNAMLCEGKADFIGFGRLAFSYEGFAKDILLNNGLSDAKCCIACNKCSELLRLGISAGCVIKDREIYLPIYRENIMNAQSAVGRL